MSIAQKMLPASQDPQTSRPISCQLRQNNDPTCFNESNFPEARSVIGQNLSKSYSVQICKGQNSLDCPSGFAVSPVRGTATNLKMRGSLRLLVLKFSTANAIQKSFLSSRIYLSSDPNSPYNANVEIEGFFLISKCCSLRVANKNVRVRMRIEMQQPALVFTSFCPLKFSWGSYAPNMSSFCIH